MTVRKQTWAAAWLDLAVSDLESLSHGELVSHAREQAPRIERQAAQITSLATQLVELMEKFEQQAAELVRLQHLLSRNSTNSSMASSKDDDPGRTPVGCRKWVRFFSE